ACPGAGMDEAAGLLLGLRDLGFVSIADGRPAVAKRRVPVGTPHPDGIFIAAGAGIRSGARSDLRNVMDVAATLLYSLDLPLPADFEGKVPEGFFTAEHLAAHPVRVGSPTLSVKDGEVQDDEIPDDEKEKIIKQLQMLGYME